MTRLLALVAALTVTHAAAQTYVRPSKGKALTIATNVDLDVVANPATLSPVYDWSAFSGVQLRMFVTKNGAPITDFLTNCNCVPTLWTLGSQTPDGTFTFQSDLAASTSFFQNNTASLTYTVGNTSPYLQFNANVPFCPPVINPAKVGCKLQVTAVPFPTDSNVRVNFGALPTGVAAPTTTISPVASGGTRREYDGVTGAATINMSASLLRMDRNSATIGTDGASYGNNTTAAPVAVNNIIPAAVFNTGNLDPLPCTAVFPAAGYPLNDYCLKPSSVTVQNVGTVAVRCAFTSTNVLPSPPVVSAVNYHFILKGGSVAGDGRGGSRTFKNITKPFTVIQCITAGGVSAVSALPF